LLQANSAITVAMIAAGRRVLSAMASVFPSVKITAGTMIAVNTAIGTKSSASSSARGNARGVRPENMTKRMQKVNRPVIIMMIQIMSCSSGQ
jgi:hypothetical protein